MLRRRFLETVSSVSQTLEHLQIANQGEIKLYGLFSCFLKRNRLVHALIKQCGKRRACKSYGIQTHFRRIFPALRQFGILKVAVAHSLGRSKRRDAARSCCVPVFVRRSGRDKCDERNAKILPRLLI